MPALIALGMFFFAAPMVNAAPIHVQTQTKNFSFGSNITEVCSTDSCTKQTGYRDSRLWFSGFDKNLGELVGVMVKIDYTASQELWMNNWWRFWQKNESTADHWTQFGANVAGKYIFSDKPGLYESCSTRFNKCSEHGYRLDSNSFMLNETKNLSRFTNGAWLVDVFANSYLSHTCTGSCTKVMTNVVNNLWGSIRVQYKYKKILPPSPPSPPPPPPEVPLPGAMALFATGLAGYAFKKRKKNAEKSNVED